MPVFTKFQLVILGLAVAITPSAVRAHVTLEQQQAPVGAPYKIVLRVPHGCGDSATIRLSVQIPEGVISIKPMVKPGWQIATTRGSYSRAYSFFHGAKFTEGVKEVSWSGGNLPDAFYDEFILSAFIADELLPGQMLYFPVVQQCEQGEHRWIEIPAAGKHAGEPAPGVMLTPKRQE
ncbi:MAG TPA: YcnI family protein [Pseudolabrys sp.]|nr:YcnI family protein [Pseudolabrys sp.]